MTKKLNEYQEEVNSQLSSRLLKQGSEAYQEAMKNIQDFSAKIYDASKELTWNRNLFRFQNLSLLVKGSTVVAVSESSKIDVLF